MAVNRLSAIPSALPKLRPNLNIFIKAGFNYGLLNPAPVYLDSKIDKNNINYMDNQEKNSQEVGYNVAGPVGRQCADCKNYQPQGADYGDCLGHRVMAGGSCNYFAKK